MVLQVMIVVSKPGAVLKLQANLTQLHCLWYLVSRTPFVKGLN